MKKDCDFIVLSAARSGSTNFVDTLNQHPQIYCERELFSHSQFLLHLHRTLSLPTKTAKKGFRVLKRMAPNLTVKLGLPFRRKSEVLYGYKILGPQAWEYRLVDYLKQQKELGVKFLHLVRRDSLDQSISLVTLSKTGVFHSNNQNAKRVDVSELTLDDFPQKVVSSLIKECHLIKAFVAEVASSLDALTLYYEDFYKNDEFYRPILEFLGVDTQYKLEHRLSKLKSESNVISALRERHAAETKSEDFEEFPFPIPDRKKTWRSAPLPPWRKEYPQRWS